MMERSWEIMLCDVRLACHLNTYVGKKPGQTRAAKNFVPTDAPSRSHNYCVVPASTKQFGTQPKLTTSSGSGSGSGSPTAETQNCKRPVWQQRVLGLQLVLLRWVCDLISDHQKRRAPSHEFAEGILCLLTCHTREPGRVPRPRKPRARPPTSVVSGRG
jgi:hypothetical protein